MQNNNDTEQMSEFEMSSHLKLDCVVGAKF